MPRVLHEAVADINRRRGEARVGDGAARRDPRLGMREAPPNRRVIWECAPAECLQRAHRRRRGTERAGDREQFARLRSVAGELPAARHEPERHDVQQHAVGGDHVAAGQ